MVRKPSPDRGDIVLLDFDPQKGREQSGRRPALVLSPQWYNAKAGLVVLCPITSKRKGYAFEVPLPPSLKTKGVILTDQIKSMDLGDRGIRFIEKTPSSLHTAVMETLDVLLR